MATTQPPFEIPTYYKARTNWVERKIPEYSDGEKRHWPGSNYRPSSYAFYLCHLANKWAEQDGIAQPGVTYYLDKLPEGYGMFEVDQAGGGQVYKRLFGHPSGRFYDSSPRFLVHFLWLMSGMDGNCECVLCGTKQSKPIIPRPRAPLVASFSSSSRGRREMVDEEADDTERSGSMGGLASRRAQRQVKQAGAPYAQDEEGTEDIYKDCVRKLELQGGSKTGIEIDLSEENSIDWQAEHESLLRHLTQIEQQHSFVPRVGELVLWCANFPDDHYLVRDPATAEYKFYSFEQKCFHGFPAWRGGIIAGVPSATSKNGAVDFPDILDMPGKKTAMNTAGFRVETMPDPNDDIDKSLSKQWKYVPLRNIRPLAQWQIILKGVSQKKLHPSVLYALTCMTSISLLEKWRFNGDWPNGRIFCKGLFLGPELIVVGDAVRLLGRGQVDEDGLLTCTDVLVITSIRYNLIEMTSRHASSNSPHLSGRSFISLVGQAYTTDARRALDALFESKNDRLGNHKPHPLLREDAKSLFRAVGADEYGPWYSLHGPRHKVEVSHEQVLGRLYEADAVRLWTGQRQLNNKHSTLPKPSLEFDAKSAIAGRKYATDTDARLPESQSSTDIAWYIADTRAQGLAIATINGLEVGRYHNIRDAPTLRQWRAQVRIADGREVGPELTDQVAVSYKVSVGGRRGRPPGSRVINGKLVRAGEYASDGAEDEEPMTKLKPSSQMAGAGFGTDSDEDEEAITNRRKDSHNPYEKLQPKIRSTTLTKPQQNQAWSKEDVMSSIETGGTLEFDDDVSDVMEWIDEPWPVRGGTEESEGGDYRSD